MDTFVVKSLRVGSFGGAGSGQRSERHSPAISYTARLERGN
jgi:hypothetical protein